MGEKERATRPEPASALNSLPELTAQRQSPSSVLINDVTLREAEQGEAKHLSADQKVRLAEALESAGVRQLQVGYPGRSEEDNAVIKEISQRLKSAAVEAVALVFLPEWEHEVDACLASGASVVLVSCRASERHRKLLGMTREELVDRVKSAVARTVLGGVTVSFVASDTTRTDLELLKPMWLAAARAGARRICIADSVGAGTPELIDLLVREARKATGLLIDVHCHDDFGLATANSLAGVMAGAGIVDVAVNGLGDRAGNASLEEVVAALELLYQQDTGIVLKDLTSLSELFAHETGVPLPRHKAITGPEVFAHVLPTHVSVMHKDQRAMQPFEASLVGNNSRLPPESA